MRTDIPVLRQLSRRLPKPTERRRLVVITGARQTGKTTLAKKMYPGLRYLNLDAIELRAMMREVRTSRWGEEVGAAVFPLQDTHPTPEELRAFCKSHLAAYKVPRYIWILDSPLPRNANGKFVKRELQQSLHVSEAG